MAINVGDAVMTLGLDSTKFDSDMSQVKAKTASGFETLKKSIVPVSAAIAAVSVVGLKMADTARKMNADLTATGITIGKTEKEMRDMALSVTNVTFPLKSVISTFDLLARAGVRTEADMKDVANAFDALADATNSSAEKVAEQLIPAYKAFNLELPRTAAEMDKFTWLTKNTTIDLADFATTMDIIAKEGGPALGLSMEDVIAILANFEAQGITGTAATRKLREVITELEASNKAAAKSEEELVAAIATAQEAKEKAAAALAKTEADAVLDRARALLDLEKLHKQMQDMEKGTLEYRDALLKEAEILAKIEEIDGKVKEAKEKLEIATDDLASATGAEAGKHKDVYDALGMTKTTLDETKGKMEEYTGKTLELGDALNTQAGIIDQLKQKYDELTLTYGPVMIAAEPFFAAMTGLSTTIIALNALHIPKLIGLLGGAAGLGAAFAVVGAGIAGWFVGETIWDKWGEQIGGALDKFLGVVDSMLTIIGLQDLLHFAPMQGPDWGTLPPNPFMTAQQYAAYCKAKGLPVPVKPPEKETPYYDNWEPAPFEGTPEEWDWETEPTGPWGGFEELQHGGIVRKSTMALLGEHGPEAVIPLQGAGIGATININVGAFMGTEENAAAFARIIGNYLHKGDRLG